MLVVRKSLGGLHESMMSLSRNRRYLASQPMICLHLFLRLSPVVRNILLTCNSSESKLTKGSIGQVGLSPARLKVMATQLWSGKFPGPSGTGQLLQ